MSTLNYEALAINTSVIRSYVDQIVQGLLEIA